MDLQDQEKTSKIRKLCQPSLLIRNCTTQPGLSSGRKSEREVSHAAACYPHVWKACGVPCCTVSRKTMKHAQHDSCVQHPDQVVTKFSGHFSRTSREKRQPKWHVVAWLATTTTSRPPRQCLQCVQGDLQATEGCRTESALTSSI